MTDLIITNLTNGTIRVPGVDWLMFAGGTETIPFTEKISSVIIPAWAQLNDLVSQGKISINLSDSQSTQTFEPISQGYLNSGVDWRYATKDGGVGFGLPARHNHIPVINRDAKYTRDDNTDAFWVYEFDDNKKEVVILTCHVPTQAENLRLHFNHYHYDDNSQVKVGVLASSYPPGQPLEKNWGSARYKTLTTGPAGNVQNSIKTYSVSELGLVPNSVSTLAVFRSPKDSDDNANGDWILIALGLEFING